MDKFKFSTFFLGLLFGLIITLIWCSGIIKNVI